MILLTLCYSYKNKRKFLILNNVVNLSSSIAQYQNWFKQN